MKVKRILALVLSLLMMLGTQTFVFAAEETTEINIVEANIVKEETSLPNDKFTGAGIAENYTALGEDGYVTIKTPEMTAGAYKLSLNVDRGQEYATNYACEIAVNGTTILWSEYYDAGAEGDDIIGNISLADGVNKIRIMPVLQKNYGIKINKLVLEAVDETVTNDRKFFVRHTSFVSDNETVFDNESGGGVAFVANPVTDTSASVELSADIETAGYYSLEAYLETRGASAGSYQGSPWNIIVSDNTAQRVLTEKVVTVKQGWTTNRETSSFLTALTDELVYLEAGNHTLSFTVEATEGSVDGYKVRMPYFKLVHKEIATSTEIAINNTTIDAANSSFPKTGFQYAGCSDTYARFGEDGYITFSTPEMAEGVYKMIINNESQKDHAFEVYVNDKRALATEYMAASSSATDEEVGYISLKSGINKIKISTAIQKLYGVIINSVKLTKAENTEASTADINYIRFTDFTADGTKLLDNNNGGGLAIKPPTGEKAGTEITIDVPASGKYQFSAYVEAIGGTQYTGSQYTLSVIDKGSNAELYTGEVNAAYAWHNNRDYATALKSGNAVYLEKGTHTLNITAGLTETSGGTGIRIPYFKLTRQYYNTDTAYNLGASQLAGTAVNSTWGPYIYRNGSYSEIDVNAAADGYYVLKIEDRSTDALLRYDILVNDNDEVVSPWIYTEDQKVQREVATLKLKKGINKIRITTVISGATDPYTYLFNFILTPAATEPDTEIILYPSAAKMVNTNPDITEADFGGIRYSVDGRAEYKINVPETGRYSLTILGAANFCKPDMKVFVDGKEYHSLFNYSVTPVYLQETNPKIVALTRAEQYTPGNIWLNKGERTIGFEIKMVHPNGENDEQYSVFDLFGVKLTKNEAVEGELPAELIYAEFLESSNQPLEELEAGEKAKILVKLGKNNGSASMPVMLICQTNSEKVLIKADNVSISTEYGDAEDGTLFIADEEVTIAEGAASIQVYVWDLEELVPFGEVAEF